MLEPQAVANVLGPLGAPVANVLKSWPIITSALQWAGIADHATLVAAAATVNVECGPWVPIEEYGGWSYYVQEFGPYEATYHGRGYIQLSWSSNYLHYGQEIGINLLGNPALALDPTIAAKVLALYFREHNIPAMADAGNWYGCRVAINGGTNGLGPFLDAVNALLSGPSGTPVTRVAIRGALKRAPNHTSEAAIAEDGRPAILSAGLAVEFTPDPSPGPTHGQQVTPHWAHVTVIGGNVHGWYLRDHLQTTWS